GTARLRARDKAGRRPQGAGSQLGWSGHALGTGANGSGWHQAHAVAQHRSTLHRDGRRRLADLLRRPRAVAGRTANWTHGRPRRHEVRRLAALARRVPKTIRSLDLLAPALSPTDTSMPRSKGLVICCWIATAVFCLQIGFTAYAQLRLPQVADMFTHLGFPMYFRVELSWAKLLGIVVLLAPVPARLKEWAHAGFAITLGSALVAHFALVDGPDVRGCAA